MGVRRFLLFLLLASTLGAAPPNFGTPPTATVGVPYSFDLLGGFVQMLQSAIQSIPAGQGVSVSFTLSVTSGSTPPGLTFHSSGIISGTPTAAGTYRFAISLDLSFTAPTVGSNSYNIPFPPFSVTVTGGGPTGPSLSEEPGLLSFSFTSSSGASTQPISVINKGNQAGAYTVSASTASGGSWLVASGGGSAPAIGSSPVQVTANPAGLAAGTYRGSVVISAGATQFNVPVVMTITSGQQILSLSQSGLTFRTVASGGTPAAQSFSVLNGGTGSLSWTATTSTLSGGSSWLSATPASGSSSLVTPTTIQVKVNPAGLAAGDYYGQVQISGAAATNSPQTATVVLTIQPATTAAVDPTTLPTGLIFVGTVGGSNPAAKTVTIGNLGGKAVTYSSQPSFDQGSKWFTSSPASGSVAAAQSVNVSVQPALAGLTVGVYTGDLALQIAETNSIHHIAILVIVIPAGGAGAPLGPGQPRSASGCTPSKLLPVFTQLGQSFSTTAAWPTTVEITAVDDCGTAMTSGAVVTTFSSGDPLLSLTSLGDGRWTGTWQARNTSTAPVTITANAQLVTPPISGSASIGGNSQANASVPVISSAGAVNAASLQANTPVAPGSYIEIMGSNLGNGVSQANTVPLPMALNGSQAILAGRAIPLNLTSDGQINGIVPFDVPVNATHQLIIQRGNAYSVAQNVTIAPTGPAAFTIDASGHGPGVIIGANADGSTFAVDKTHPVTAGIGVVIYCVGLGAVAPPVAAGAAAPLTSLSPTTNPVTVSIGGQPAQVLYSGLAPGFVGVYQVNAVVPSGVTPGDAPVVISVAGQDSPPVTMAVQ